MCEINQTILNDSNVTTLISDPCIKQLAINHYVVPTLLLLWGVIFGLILIIAIFNKSIKEANFWIIFIIPFIIAFIFILLIINGVIPADLLYETIKDFLG